MKQFYNYFNFISYYIYLLFALQQLFRLKVDLLALDFFTQNYKHEIGKFEIYILLDYHSHKDYKLYYKSTYITLNFNHFHKSEINSSIPDDYIEVLCPFEFSVVTQESFE